MSEIYIGSPDSRIRDEMWYGNIIEYTNTGRQYEKYSELSSRGSTMSTNFCKGTRSYIKNVFKTSKNFKTMYSPSSYTSGLFYNNKNLLSFKSNDLTSIGNYAFYQCSNLSSVNCPNATSIGIQTFRYCSNLSSINIPNVTSIGNSAFGSCSNLSSINCPNVTSIGTYAFYNCAKLSSIDIPNVTSIGESAFENSKLSSINCHNVTSIGTYAFCYCLNLSSINIPNVNSIGNAAFQYCSNLSSIDFSQRTLTTIPTLVNTLVFLYLPSNYQIKVPSALYNNWIAATNWSSIKSHIVAV